MEYELEFIPSTAVDITSAVRQTLTEAVSGGTLGSLVVDINSLVLEGKSECFIPYKHCLTKRLNYNLIVRCKILLSYINQCRKRSS